MEELENELLDTQNQDVENAIENQNAQLQEDNKEDDKITLSRKEYEALIGQKKYYQTQYKAIKDSKNNSVKTDIQTEQKSDVDNDETLIISLRQDNPLLSREDAAEISKTIKKIAVVNGTSTYEAINDDYVKSLISNKISKQQDYQATPKSSHVAGISNNDKIDTKALFDKYSK